MSGVRRLRLSPTGRGPGFSPLNPAGLGMDFVNRLSPARYATKQNLMNGAGVAAADFDGDGWCDLYFCNKEAPAALYRNLGGWRFENVTAAAGVSTASMLGAGAVFADLNGDGHPDLFVTSFQGPDALFMNLGGGRFTNVTVQAGVASRGGATSASAGDVDGDGDLDLYVCHFGVEAILRDGAVIKTRVVDGQPVVMGRFAKRLRILNGRMTEYGEADVLFLNDGNGKFTPAPWSSFLDEAGRPLLEAPPDFGLAVLIRDIDGNGTADIYVCNDFQTPDRVWLGDGKGKFRAAPPLAFRGMSYASMGVDCADLERNGRWSLLTVEMLSRDHRRNLSQRSPMDASPRTPGDYLVREMFPRNALHYSRGDGTYAEIGWYSGLAMSDWSWSPIFVDVDLDGYEDLLVSNGHMHDVNDLDVNSTRSSDPAKRAEESAQQVVLRYPRLNPPKAAWRNRGDLSFEDRADAWRFNSTSIVHGLVLADLDNDGDPDVVGNAWNEAPYVCRNESPAPRVAVRLRGARGNPDGIGARVRLSGGAVPQQEQEVRAGGRYLSSDQPQLTFAAGTAKEMSLEVRWRNGRTSRLSGVLPNHLYLIEESAASTGNNEGPSAKPPSAPALFEALAVPPEMTHREVKTDDFVRQRLLPWRLSRVGPGLAVVPGPEGIWVVLGGGRGDRIRGYRVGRDGQPAGSAVEIGAALPDNVTALTGVELAKGRWSLFAGLSRSGSGEANPPSALRFDHDGKGWTTGVPVPGDGSVTGALASGDIDGDGDADLLVGGRFVPGRYPEPCNLRVFLNDAGALRLDAERSGALKKVGMVTGCVIADFNGDGRSDVAMSCEWGSLRVFVGDARGLRDATQELGLEAHSGLWQCLVAADFDGDGKTDLAAGNWGQNSYHQRAPQGPWHLYFAEIEGAGHLGLIESYFNPDMKGPVPFRGRDTLAVEFPWLTAEFPAHRDFAGSTLSKILGSRAPMFRSVSATSLASAVFMNRGSKFERLPLPAPAQWTPILGLAAADCDGDGRSDLVCSQNLFAVRDEDDRLDAGRGLVLLNRAKDGWVPLSAEQSGLAVYGDQRAVVARDLDGDGRTDIAMAQNAGPLVIHRNRAAR